MNLEDLILDTQISELKRLQTGCIKARETIQRIQSLTAQLDEQAARAKAEFQSEQDKKTQRQIERVESEARKLREQKANQAAHQHQAARSARAEQIKALNAQLKQDIADCQQKLQSRLSELRHPEAGVNSLLTAAGEVQEEVSSSEISHDLPEFDLAEPDRAMPRPEVAARRNEIDQQVSDLEQQVRDAVQKKFGPRSKAFSKLPAASVELTSGESETAAVTDHIALASAAIERFSTQKPATWGRGLLLSILGLLIFCVGTVASALAKIDIGSLMAFDLSEADFTWLGISCGVGFALSIIVALLLRKLASRSVNLAAQEMLLHTSNAKAVAEHQENCGEPEAAITIETPAMPVPLLQSAPVANRVTAVSKVKHYDHQREAELIAAAGEQINASVSRHAKQIDMHLAQFEEQFLQSKTESEEAYSSVENWRQQELSRIQDHATAALEQAFSKLAQDVQAKQDHFSTEAATSLSKWKANVLIASEVARISAERATRCPSWEQLCSQSWTAPAPSSLPATLTAGSLELTMPVAPETAQGKLESSLKIQLPGLLNFPRDASIAIEHDADGRNTALDFVQAISLRLLTSVAPGQLQFTLIDAVSTEHGLSSLTELAKYDKQLIDSQVWSDSSQIEASLRRVSERIDRVLKVLLESGANSLDEHNAMATGSREPYHFVVIAGFPTNFTEEAASLLTSILNGGALCGVHVVAMWSSDLAIPRTFKIKTLQKNCTQFHVKNGAVQAGSSLTTDNRNETSELVLFSAIQSPSRKEFETIVAAVGERLRPQSVGNDTVTETPMLLAQRGPSETTGESPESIDTAAVTNGAVSEDSYSAEPSFVVSSSTVEATWPETPAPDVPTFDAPVAGVPAFGSSASEPELVVQEFAAMPVTQSLEHDPSDVNSKDPEFIVEEVPVAEGPAIEQPGVEEVVADHPVAGEISDEVSARQDNNVANEAGVQALTQVPVPTSVAPTIETCVPFKEKLAQEFTEPNSDGVSVWIGESNNNAAMGYKSLRARGQNTLIVGQNDNLADAVFASTILSLCAGQASQHNRSPKVILVHDGMNQESLRRFAASFSDTVTPRFSIRSAASVDDIVAELLEEMHSREKNRTAKESPEIVFAVRNIGQFPTLRRDYENTQQGSSKSAPSVPRFGDLLRQGPRVGIHVMMWADTFEVALQCLSNSLLRECDTRIALTMNAQDSTSLIGSPSASNIEADSAILFSEQTGSAHQFRPFAWPSTEWLVTLPQSTALVPDVVTGTMQVEAPSTDPAEVKDSEESFDNDGFTLADDVVPVVSPDQTASEKMSVSETAISPDAATKSNIDTPRSEENVSTSATFDPAIGTSKSESKSVKSKSAKGNRKQTASMPETTFSHTETTSTSATESANVVASAVSTPQKPTPSLPEKRVSGMALRMSSRNSDPLRPLDAPPEPQTQVVSNEPGPEVEFDEMDFNSLLIE